MKNKTPTIKNLPAIQVPAQVSRVAALPKIEAVPTLPRLATKTKAVTELEYRRKLAAQQEAARLAQKEKSYTEFGGLKDANDPYVLNSFSDALFNRKAKEKRYGDFAETLHKVPVIGDLITSVVAATDLSAENIYDIFTGDFKAAGINVLTSFSETADILANPVKSLVTPLVNQNTTDEKYQLPWYERVASGFGFSDLGRYNYDYDTGFWLSDMGLEMISDPLNIIFSIFTGGGWGSLKAAGSGLAKNAAKTAAKEVAEETVEQGLKNIAKTGVKVVSKVGKEVTEEALEKAVIKNASSSLIKKTVGLRRLANKISAATKRLAKVTGDDATRRLAQNLDEILGATKGIIDDTVKGSVKGITDTVTALAKNGDLTDDAINAIKDLLKLTDEFAETSSYTLKDLIGDFLGDTSDDLNTVLNKAGKKEATKLRKLIKKAATPEDITKLEEQLKMLFSSPEYIKKYRHTFNLKNMSFDELASKIDLTDYLNAANEFLVDSRAFKLALAMDKLAEGTKVVDDIVLKLAFYSASPLAPIVTQVLRPGASFIFKNLAKTPAGKFVISYCFRKLDDVAEFFSKKFKGVPLLVHDEMQEAYARVIKNFDVFAGTKLGDTNFEKEIAQSVYNDAYKWLRGYAPASAYAPTRVKVNDTWTEEYKSVNLLNATRAVQEENIKTLYYSKFREMGLIDEMGNLSTDVDIVEYYFKELDRIGQLGFGYEKLQEWSVSDYIAQLKVTDQLLLARNAYADFDRVLGQGNAEYSKSTKSVLKYVKDIDTKAVTSPQGLFSKAKEQLKILDFVKASKQDSLDAIQIKISKTLDPKVFSMRDKKKRVQMVNALYGFTDAVETAQKEFEVLEALKKAAPEKEEIFRQKQQFKIRKQEDVWEDAITRMHYAANSVRNALSDFAKQEEFKKTEFAELYKVVQKMASPYYGQKYRTNLEEKVFFEITNSAQMQTIEILKDKSFQELIDAFRPGNAGAKLLNKARLEAEERIQILAAETADNALALSAKKDAQKILYKIDSIASTLEYIDAYVEHMALVKQSQLPEYLQEIYLEVLAEYPIRDAGFFIQNFDANASEFIKRMNDKLTNRFATNSYTQEAIATQLLEADGFKASAERYLSSARTALDEAAFAEATYKAQVLPEFSKHVLNEKGEETSQYVYRRYGSFKDKQQVYVSFKTAGNNPSINEITDLALKCGDKTWAYNPEKSEIENLLDFYKQLRAISDKGEFVVISHNRCRDNIDFMQTRIYELMEETYIRGLGDAELYREFQAAKRRKASPDELAEIYNRMHETVNDAEQKLFQELITAQTWLERTMYYSNISITEMLRKFDEVPTVGEHYKYIKEHFLLSYTQRQKACGGKLHLTLDKTLLDNIKSIPAFSTTKLKQIFNRVSKVFDRIQNYDSTLFARGDAYALNGRMLIDGDFYKNGIFQATGEIINVDAVRVENTAELLNLGADGRWTFRGSILPQEVTTANEAVRYLKDKGVTYAPKWRAMNPEQQLSTYPVLINGKVTLQQVEGTIPVTVKKYVDYNLTEQFFVIKNPKTGVLYWRNYREAHHYTSIAEQASEVLSYINNPQDIEEIAPVINRVWEEVLNYSKEYDKGWSPYGNLRNDLNVYQKYAILSVLYRDNTSGSPSRGLQNALKKQVGTVTAGDIVKELQLERPVRPKRYHGFKGARYAKMKDVPGIQALPYEELKPYEKLYRLPDFIPYPKEPVEFTARTRYNLDKHMLGVNDKNAQVYYTELKRLKAIPGMKAENAKARAYKKYLKHMEKVNKSRLAEYNALKKKIESANIKVLEAHKKSVDAENAPVLARIEEIKAANSKLYDAYKADLDRLNAETKAALDEVYETEMKAYNAWWAELDEAAQLLEKELKALPENVSENLLRDRAYKLVKNPQYYISRESDFRRIYTENYRSSNLNYNDVTMSRTSYIDYIYSTELRGTIDKSRELHDALQEVNQDVLNSTKAFKTALERPKTGGQFRSVYAPGMQRHATLGMSLIDLNDKVIQFANSLRDGAEFDAFISCDKQVVNNMEDLILKQVFSLDTEHLTSFVHHQGKGIVVIPIAKYLTDSTAHNIDLRLDIQTFLEHYKNLDSPILGMKKVKDNLVLYIKDYELHVKQNDIVYRALDDLDINDAFRAAYGYRNTTANAREFKRAKDELATRYKPDSHEYQEALNKLQKQFAKTTGITTKQSAFLAQHYDGIETLRKAYYTHFDSLRKLSVDYDSQYAYMRGGYGRTMDFQTYKTVMDSLPTSIRNEIGLLDDMSLERVFNTANGDIFNFTTLGRAAYRLDIEPYATSNYQSIMSNTYRSMAYNLSAATQYAQFYFEDSPWALKNFFQYAKSQEEILIALKSTDGYTVSTLGMNDAGLPVVKELHIDTLEDLQNAIKANAILTPTTTYGSISQTLNNRRWNNSKFKMFHKLSYYAKMAMLVLNPGFILRNLVDSTLKNVLIAKDKSAVLDTYLEALDLHQRYQDTINLLFAVNKDHPFRPDVLEIVFKDSTAPLTEAQFMLVHNFYENGPSAGSIDTVAKYYLQQSLNKGTAQQSTLQKFIDNCMRPTKDLEDITRLSAYLEAIKQGMTNLDAFELIRKTHFDYGNKTNIQHILELVFPFYSFKLKNFEFWLDYAARNPAITYGLVQLTTSNWNWSEIDFDRIEYYQSQINHMTQANIKLNEQGLTLKLNPSIMDPVNILLNPIESFSDSVAPWMQPIVDALMGDEPYNYEELLGTTAGSALAMAPGPVGIAGMALATGSQYANRLDSGQRAAARTDSLLPLVLPSVFGSVRTPAQYGKASYTNSRAYMDPARRVPRRVNIYSKYYTDTGKNKWKIRFYPIDAATVQYRIRDNYNRFR